MRTLSLSLREAMFAERTEELLLVLLTISHPDMDTPLRLVMDLNNVVSRGDEYLALPCDIQLPGETDEQAPQAKLVLDNVDRRLTAILDGISSAPTVDIELVRWAAPDTVEASWPGMRLTQVSYDNKQVSGTLTYEEVNREAFPKGTFSPGWFPGMF